VIELANPITIFVFGLKHQDYSLPVIRESGIPYIPAVHPIMDKEGRFFAGWRDFERMLLRLREEQRVRKQERNSIAKPYFNDNFMALWRCVWSVSRLALIALVYHRDLAQVARFPEEEKKPQIESPEPLGNGQPKRPIRWN
jgi:hypothetical protein